jgi:predicted AlkP superfamily phosphohydrolase/phosphomutase
MENKDPKYGNEILKFYQKIDKAIGNFLNQTDKNTTVIIMSDHGFGSFNGEIYLNYYFMEKGMLKLKSPFTYWLIKLGLTQQNLANKLQSVPIFKFFSPLIERLGLLKTGEITPYLTYNDIDFSKTKLYAENFGGGIYLNIKGRDSSGIVAEEDYKKLILSTMKDLSELKNSNGKKIFESVFTKEDLYKGPYVDQAPDLIVESESNGYDSVGWLGYNTLTSNNDVKSGNHRKNGIVILWGMNVNKNVTKNASIIDIAPTVLKMIGLKIPEDIDGKSLIDG